MSWLEWVRFVSLLVLVVSAGVTLITGLRSIRLCQDIKKRWASTQERCDAIDAMLVDAEKEATQLRRHVREHGEMVGLRFPSVH